MKLTKLSMIGLTSATILAGIALSQTNGVHASTLSMKYSSNVRQAPTIHAAITGGLAVGTDRNYQTVAQADGYTWYQLANNQWVANAGAQPITGKLTVIAGSNKRTGPGLKYQIVGSFTTGQSLSFTNTTKADGYTWYQVGNGAWVASAGTREVSDTNAVSTAAIKQSTTTSEASNGASQAASTASATTPVQNSTAASQSSSTRSATAQSTTTQSTVTQSTVTQSTTGTSVSAKAAAVIALARQQVGKPYVYGAKGPNSFDCSGLMYYVFSHALGMNIGGWTGTQQYAGTRVNLSNLQPGDLLFWGNSGTPYHDALYIGNNQFIDAPKPGETVRVSTISSYFMPSFGVRVLK